MPKKRPYLSEGIVREAIEIATRHNVDVFRLGYAVKDPKKQVFLRPKRQRREGKKFYKY